MSQLLDDATNHPVTLLTAPAGWGKTAAVRSWLDHRTGDDPVAWLSLRRTGHPLPSPADVAAEGAAVLVLDDLPYGRSDALDPTGFVADLLAIDGTRLVIATRDARDLPLPQWRLTDQVSEIGCAELAFTRDEAADLLTRHELALSTVEAEALYARTEGWPAGLRFATLRADAADPLIAEQSDVVRYLEAEVLAGLPERTRDLLRRTSLLDRVCADLASALLTAGTANNSPDDSPNQSAGEELAALSMAGGFILPLGGNPPWYRYHRQFREALRADVRRAATASPPDGEAELHGRAMEWLRDNGLVCEAIRYGGDPTGLVPDRPDHGSPGPGVLDHRRHGDEWLGLGDAWAAEFALAGCHLTAADRGASGYPTIEHGLSERVAGEPGDREAARRSDGSGAALAFVVDRISRGDPAGADAGLDRMRHSGGSGTVIAALELARDRLRGGLTRIASSAAALRSQPGDHRLALVATAAQAAAMLGSGDLSTAATLLGLRTPWAAAHASESVPDPTPTNGPDIGPGSPDDVPAAGPNGGPDGGPSGRPGGGPGRGPDGGPSGGPDGGPGRGPDGGPGGGRGGGPGGLDSGPDAGPARFCAARALQGLRSLTLAVFGELRPAYQEAQAALALPPCPGQPRDVHSEPALLALALVHHEWDQPAQAQRSFDLAVRARALTVEPELATWARLIEARLRAANGDLAGASTILREAELTTAQTNTAHTRTEQTTAVPAEAARAGTAQPSDAQAHNGVEASTVKAGTAPAGAVQADATRTGTAQPSGARASNGDAGTAEAPARPTGMAIWFVAAQAELALDRGAGATLAPDRSAGSAPEADLGDGSGSGENGGDPAIAVVAARVALRDGDPHTAARTLPPWDGDGSPHTMLSVRLDAGLVEARVAHALGDRRRAGQVLERVLDLASPQGFRRPFRKDPEALRELLVEHLESGTGHWSTVDELVGQPPTLTASPRDSRPDALTERELTVLRYLQSMLSNEEIAAKLFVSVNTVKTHIRHIYRKLEVNQRRDAVRRGREARLL